MQRIIQKIKCFFGYHACFTSIGKVFIPMGTMTEGLGRWEDSRNEKCLYCDFDWKSHWNIDAF